MPTTIAVATANANSVHPVAKILAIIDDPDFKAIVIFAAVGLLIAIGLTVALPLPDNLAAQLIQLS